ncbi:hypothetical protein D3C78_1199340 [compost metagenome]
MTMQILHHGAWGCVTGSCHQLFICPEHSLLIDCGLFHGAETSGGDKTNAERLEIDLDITSAKALASIQVHIDHPGRIPQLLTAGFKGGGLHREASGSLLAAELMSDYGKKISELDGMRLAEQPLAAAKSTTRPASSRSRSKRCKPFTPHRTRKLTLPMALVCSSPTGECKSVRRVSSRYCG